MAIDGAGSNPAAVDLSNLSGFQHILEEAGLSQVDLRKARDRISSGMGAVTHQSPSPEVEQDTTGGLAPMKIDIPSDLGGFSPADVMLILNTLISSNSNDSVVAEQEAIRNNQDRINASNQKVAARLNEASGKIKEAEDGALGAQIAGWLLSAVVTLVSVIVSIATLGAAAPAMIALTCVCIGVSLAVSVVDAAGGFEAMQEAIAEALEEQYASQHPNSKRTDRENAAQMNAMGTVMAIQLSISAVLLIVTLGASAGETAKQAADKVVDGAQAAVKAVLKTLVNAAKESADEASDAATKVAVETAKQTATEVAKAATDVADDAAQTAVKAVTGSVDDAAQGIADGAAEAAQQSSKMIKVARNIQTTVTMIGALGQAGTSASGIHTANLQQQSIELQADTEELKANVARLQALMRSNQDFIKEIMQVLNSMQTNVVSMLNQEHQTMNAIARIPNHA